jgi:hypothetical protein
MFDQDITFEAPYVEAPDLYIVNEHGVIRHRSGRVLPIRINKTNTPYVTLQIDGRQVTRSVSRIVSEAFVTRKKPWDDPEIFNTPIHLDGDRLNCRATNLRWRPRWFAIEYHKQFSYPGFFDGASVEVIETGRVFRTIGDLCVHYGILRGRALDFLWGMREYLWLTDITIRWGPD